MRSIGRVFVLIAATATVAGCLLTTDLTGLSGSPAAGEASTKESGDPLDGTLPQRDGTTTAEAGDAGSVCDAGKHDFCADFDDGMLSVPPWTTLSRDGMLTVDDGPSVSPPKALHATLPARGALGQTLRDRAFKKWVMAWSAVHVEVDVFVAAPAWTDTDKEVELVEIGLTSDTLGAGVALFIQKGGTFAVPGKTGETSVQGPAFPYGAWTHVTIDVDASHFRLAYGDQVLTKTHGTVSPGLNPQVIAFFGLSSYSDPICAFDVRLDNVVVDFK